MAIPGGHVAPLPLPKKNTDIPFFPCQNLYISRLIPHLKVKTSIGNAPISKNEMEALITNHVKEYVLNNT